MKNKLILLCISIFIVYNFAISQVADWPKITSETRPWARWWWHGNAVNENDIAYCIRQYQKAGLGGLELTPIYGVRGYESQFINYLSPKWVENLLFTLKEASKYDIIIDMATGTGWPFGGPWIDDQHACKYLTYKIFKLSENEKLNENLNFVQKPILRTIGKKLKIEDVKYPITLNDNLQEIAFDQVRYPVNLPIIAVVGFSDKGEFINLTKFLNNENYLEWMAPKGNWTIYALYQGWHGKMVERAAPGGEGNVIDHFSKEAINFYLSKFDTAFKDKDLSNLRAFFNDSYEVDDAIGESNWTPDFLQEFEKRKGYSLLKYLPALFQHDTLNKLNVYVLQDYRQVISDLLLEKFTLQWKNWANSKNKIIRNQAHGSPANLLDLYSASDIPETEGTDIFGIKLASSAANVDGKKLSSCEAATWLDEHFKSTLEKLKENIDNYFLGGINHIIYHGIPYSPRNENWPGWLFYASVHLGPTNTFFKHFAALNNYVTRAQSFLQNSLSDNEILVYYPFYDYISIPGKSLLTHFKNELPRDILPEFIETIENLKNYGYDFDYISDKQIQDLRYENNNIITGGNNKYKIVLIPYTQFMPVATLEKIINLSQKGATVIFIKSLPYDIPGLSNRIEHYEKFKTIINNIKFKDYDNYKIANIEKGSIYLINKIEDLKYFTFIKKEILPKYGIKFLRKKDNNSTIYLIKNCSDKNIDNWIQFATSGKTVVIYNPLKNIKGKAKTKKIHKDNQLVYLQIEPNETLIVRFFANKISSEKKYVYYKKLYNEYEIKGNWKIEFIEGGPQLPESINTEELKSWTDFNEQCKYFSGIVKYTITFKKPIINSDAYIIEFERIAESANIVLNNIPIDTIFNKPYKTIIKKELIKDENKLEIYVANLMANRIIFMDKNNINYKKFYNINFPARFRENVGEDGLFTTKHWQPFESGIIGKIRIIPVKIE